MEQNNKIDRPDGYPHYPANEDITHAGNNNGRARMDGETIPEAQFNDTVDATDKETAIVKGTEADLTDEDIWMLESSGQNMDTPDGRNLINSALDDTDNDGDPLNEPGSMMNDVSGADLDVPGSSADDADDLLGEEDEENNYYSLGGDLHENQEEDKGD